MTLAVLLWLYMSITLITVAYILTPLLWALPILTLCQPITSISGLGDFQIHFGYLKTLYLSAL